MKRTVIPELLDSDSGTPQEVADSLADLRRINRWFGGTSTMLKLVRAAAHETKLRTLTLLDVAAASGDIATSLRTQLAQEGITLQVTLLDRAATHLNGKAPSLAADAMRLPFRDDSFDLVSCSLFFHHLEPSEAVAFLREALRVCRTAVLVNDLRRDPLHLALVYAGMPLYRSRLTRHDAPASVRRAYTSEEAVHFAESAGAARVHVADFYLFRMGLTLWKGAQ